MRYRAGKRPAIRGTYRAACGWRALPSDDGGLTRQLVTEYPATAENSLDGLPVVWVGFANGYPWARALAARKTVGFQEVAAGQLFVCPLANVRVEAEPLS